MSASDLNGYFVELGEYNLIIARATFGATPRTIDAIKEVWIGDAAGTETALNEIRTTGSPAKAIALLRLKGRGIFLSDANQARTISSADGVGTFLSTALGAENTPASWAWTNPANGQLPQGGSKWVIDAASKSNTDDAVEKIRSWSFDLQRCQSAPLTLAGALAAAAKGETILLLEIAENSTALIAVSGQGITGLTSIPVGLDALAGSTQTTLGLKFRGSAARLMFNESYDFADAATGIVEPLVAAVKAALPSLSIAPTKVVCGGVLARQSWIAQAVSKGLGLTPFTFDPSGWAGGRGLAFGAGITASDVAPSWLGVLNAIASYELSSPGGIRPWNPLITNTPLAAAPVVPAILVEPPKPAAPPPAVVPAIIQEPPKPTTPAKPAVIPAIIQEPPKATGPAAPAKPAIVQEPPKAAAKPSTPVAQPKPAVIITPPAKPVESAKPATPPAKPATPAPTKPATPAKPAEPAKPAASTPPAKPAPAPSAVAKPGAKPEPAKPAATGKPAPAPVVAGTKPATAAPFPPKKGNLPIIIAIIAVVVIGAVAFFLYSNKKSQQEAAEREQKIRIEAEAKIKAQERARAEAEKKAEEERQARAKELQDAQARLQTQQEEARKQQEEERNRYLYGRGIFVVNTDPVGASVTVGELGTKTAPVTMKDLRLGSYTVTIAMAGYDSETRTIDIKDKETTDLGTVTLKRQYGSIELNSEPSNLAYEVKPAGSLFVSPSDVRTGQTPATLDNLPVGSYQVSIRRTNWPVFTSTVTVERNGTARVNGEFPGGTVIINSTPQGATVLRDNQIQVGTTPLTLNGIPPGNVSFTVTMRGSDPVTVSGKLDGSKPLTLNATMAESDRIMKLSELDERPVPISQADPELTGGQLEDGGSALISLVVGKDGVPTELRVEQSSTPAYGKACMAAAAKWRFKPGVIRGRPARTRVSIPFKIAGANQ